MKYRVFTRNWWKYNSVWPHGLEPDAEARKTTIEMVDSAKEAKDLCTRYNDHTDPGRLCRRAEYTRES